MCVCLFRKLKCNRNWSCYCFYFNAVLLPTSKLNYSMSAIPSTILCFIPVQQRNREHHTLCKNIQRVIFDSASLIQSHKVLYSCVPFVRFCRHKLFHVKESRKLRLWYPLLELTFSTWLFLVKKRGKKGSELKYKLSGTPTTGTNRHHLPNEQNAVYSLFYGETVNRKNLLTTKNPQFDDVWMYSLLNPDMQAKAQTYLCHIAKNP